MAEITAINKRICEMKMKIEKEYIINNIEDTAIQQTICTFIKNFAEELKGYNKATEENEGVFSLTERPYVGLFNNAIVRKDKGFNYITLQEYSLIDNTNKTLRPDLLVINDKTKTAFIIEAKHYNLNQETDTSYTAKESLNSFETALKQAKVYYQIEKTFYKNRKLKVYTCALFFESINITSKDAYFSVTDNLKDEKNYFCYTVSDKNIKNKVLNISGIISLKDDFSKTN